MEFSKPLKAFISYSGTQLSLARDVSNHLGSDQCFFAPRDFESGETISGNIATSIENSSLVVFIICNAALESDYVAREMEYVKTLLDQGEEIEVLPVISEATVNRTDKRIPRWLRDYTLNTYLHYLPLARKIQEKLREIVRKNNPYVKAREEIFLGRETLMGSLLKQIYDGNISQRRCIVATGHEMIGRTRFITEFVRKFKRLNETWEPVIFILEDHESIDEFLLQLHNNTFVKNNNEITNAISSEVDIDSKVNIAVELINYLADQRMFPIIKDRNACVKFNRTFSGWFQAILRNPELKREISLFIVTKYELTTLEEERFPEVIQLKIPILTKPDIKAIFFATADLMEIKINKADSDFICEKFTGLPEQVFITIKSIKNDGVERTKRELDQIIRIGDTEVINTLKQIEQYKKEAIDLLILLAKFEIISYGLIDKITEKFNNKAIKDLLEALESFPIFEYFGAQKQYFKVLPFVSDYIERSKQKTTNYLENRVRDVFKEELLNLDNENDALLEDLSSMLYTIKFALREGKKIPERYRIPSIMLKVIMEQYNTENYEDAIRLCDEILQNTRRLYREIERESRHWLCMSLARLKNERFEEEVLKLDGLDREYLRGFYLRMKKRFSEAEGIYRSIIAKYNKYEISKVKRELVNVLMWQGKYDDALETARQNYYSKKNNTFHAEAYFKCLVRKKTGWSAYDITEMKQIIDSMKVSFDRNRDLILKLMQAEYMFFVEREVVDSIRILNDIRNSRSRLRFHAQRTLLEAYKRQGYDKLYQNEINRDNIDDFDNELMTQ